MYDPLEKKTTGVSDIRSFLVVWNKQIKKATVDIL